MRGDDAGTRDVLPVGQFIGAGENITGIEGAYVALIPPAGELLTDIVCGEHFSGRSGHPAGKIGCDMARLSACGFTGRRSAGNGRNNNTNTERQSDRTDDRATTQCGNHR